jgi:hypothetical protein
MAQTSQLSKSDIALFLQQLQTNPANITAWNPLMRMSLLRGGLIDLTIYSRRVASAPRFALMAASSSALAFLAKHPRAPAINFTFDVPAPQTGTGNGKAKLSLGEYKMCDAQIKVHEAALVAIARWLTALCTPVPQPLVADSLLTEIAIRFICANVLGMPGYVQHLTSKFVDLAGKMALNQGQATELVRSCRGEGDALLIGLAGKLVEKKINGQIAGGQLDIFLACPGNGLLKDRIEGLEREMGIVPAQIPEPFKSIQQPANAIFKAPTANIGIPRKMETKKENARVWEVMHEGDKMDVETGVVELDAEGWQVFHGVLREGSPRKKQKTQHGMADCK